MAKVDLNQMYANLSKIGQSIPSVMKAFEELHVSAVGNGALSAKEKELIALGIGVAVHCSYCIADHVNSCLKAGATRDEIMEVLGVAILMGGGPAAAYATEAVQVLEDAGK
ncbi:alkylhydroperoxidase like protein, AhpD family [Thermoanaerobacterium xylanolyticum LX-11]|uniref:Alkylhydroperoxidase like protein, AhpD family n=1 Tax=Thermoanaerobacterium xylanolyticum (strain ATCC 49914 / DSM 7097 / LX-11) TaxID=858215 RepID=F6BJI6_THEXL|nr:carboxymuconolactone decarboxylase family protein [Thermoanaerobacterium xylanolyticum]AEF16954.1 alkylhydroperoxidase like protein, AhpD family [Thermoanaerobacterium xylanolyticum LX-11]